MCIGLELCNHCTISIGFMVSKEVFMMLKSISGHEKILGNSVLSFGLSQVCVRYQPMKCACFVDNIRLEASLKISDNPTNLSD